MIEKEKEPSSRTELIAQWKEYEKTGAAMPLVRDATALSPGDLLDIVDPFGGPNVGKFFVLALSTKHDEKGIERTFVSGIRSEARSYRGDENNPAKLAEYVTLSGRHVKSLTDLAEIATSMAVEPIVFKDPNLPIVEYDARSIGVLPINETGDYTDYAATFLARPAKSE